jgi:hypothetical protein
MSSNDYDDVLFRKQLDKIFSALMVDQLSDGAPLSDDAPLSDEEIERLEILEREKAIKEGAMTNEEMDKLREEMDKLREEFIKRQRQYDIEVKEEEENALFAAEDLERKIAADKKVSEYLNSVQGMIECGELVPAKELENFKEGDTVFVNTKGSISLGVKKYYQLLPKENHKNLSREDVDFSNWTYLIQRYININNFKGKREGEFVYLKVFNKNTKKITFEFNGLFQDATPLPKDKEEHLVYGGMYVNPI